MATRRRDIDGLRALAVLAVLGFHTFPTAVPGGFAGVDVFFVISGYLISRIILADDFTFGGFYARRLRRIVPALVVVLAACLAAGWLLLLAGEYASLGKHVAGGAGFASNFVLWDEVGYFDAIAATKPLLHLWSLGIEEQFYLAWPLVLRLGRRWALPVTIVLAVASFALPGFYLPQARLWELLIGAAIARHPGVRAGIGCDVIGTAGLAAIAISFARPSTLLVPTCGAALAILTGEHARVGRAVARLHYIGRISYPLYLWHWPILSMLRILDGEQPSLQERMGALAASFVLAAATHRFIEQPLQRGPTRRGHVLGLCAALVLVGTAGLELRLHDGLPARTGEAGAPSFDPQPFANAANCGDTHPFARNGGCYESADALPQTLVVIGDSHGVALVPGFIHARLGLHLRIFTQVGCMPFLDAEFVDADGHRPYHCREAMTGALVDSLADPRVTTVVLVARHAIRATLQGFHEPALVGDLGHFELPDGTRAPAAVFRASLAATIVALQARHIRVVFVDQVPELGFEPRACIRRPLDLGRRETCTIARAEVDARQAPYRRLVDEVLATSPGVIRIDPLPLFCTAEVCSPWRDGAMLYHDRDHLSPLGAQVLTAEILRHL